MSNKAILTTAGGLKRTAAYITLLLIILAYMGVTAGGARAQQPPQPTQPPAQPPALPILKVNQVDGRGWPDIYINLSLAQPDGQSVPGVALQQFEVQENNVPQSLTGLNLGEAHTVPLSLVLALDVSGSMAGDKLNQAKSSASTFLASFRPEDRVALLSFNDTVRTIVPFTKDTGALQAGVNGLQAGGNTAAYDALYRAAQLLSDAPAGQRRAIILLSDGADTSSSYAQGVAAEVAKKTGALVYTIGLGADAVDSALKKLAEPSGGTYYKAPAPADLQAIYKTISLELSSQFVLKYKSATRTARSYELVTVRLKYTTPDGQILLSTVRYRPPAAAVMPRTPDPVVTIPTPIPQPAISILPPKPVTQPVSTASSTAGGILLRLLTLIAVLFVLAAGILLVGGLIFFGGSSRVKERLAAYIKGDNTATQQRGSEPSFLSRAILPLISWIGRRLARLSPSGYAERIQNQLMLTGPPYKMQLSGFLGAQFALGILLTLPLVYWVAQQPTSSYLQWVLAVILGVGFGAYLPYFWLARKVGRRRKALLRALPGALDFLAINVESGMGFDSALAQVVQRWHNALTDEFALLLIDFQIGMPRRDAWRSLVRRTQLPDLSAFVTVMLQNEQVGSSIGHLLKTQAEYMRTRRRQRAEEQARTVPVKMLLPMVFFIFPGILVVVLGPAIPQFLRTFGDLGK